VKGWCFWINLPLGGITLATVFLFLNVPSQQKQTLSTWRDILEKFDVLGTIFLVPALVSLVLALGWGGNEYPWANWRIILLLVVFGVCGAIWLVIQVWEGDKATLPMHIIKHRSMVSVMFYMFAMMGVLFTLTYYIPIWFQAVLNVSAYQSGVNTLSNSGAMGLTAALAGVVVCSTLILL